MFLVSTGLVWAVARGETMYYVISNIFGLHYTCMKQTMIVLKLHVLYIGMHFNWLTKYILKSPLQICFLLFHFKYLVLQL